MCTTRNWKAGILAIAMILVCGAANAQHWHRYYRPNRVVTVVVQPEVVSHVSNRFNQKERLAMAIAYLETHEHLTIRQYAKMTRLSMAAAEAELDARFCYRQEKADTTCNQRKKESVYQKAIEYEEKEKLEIMDIWNDGSAFDAILCGCAQSPPSPSSPTLYALLPTG